MKTIKIVLFLFTLFIAIIFNIKMPSRQSKLKLSGEASPPISNDTAYSSYEQSKSMDIPNLTPFPSKGIPVLMYHSISTNPKNSLCVSEKQFKKEIEWLYNHNYHTLNMDEFYQALVQGAPIADNPILITFDDGYLDNYKTAWPILKKYGFHATFLIVTSHVDSNHIDWNQLKELISEGNSIGSHSVNHYNLKTLTYKQQERELSESKQTLENRLGVNIKAFCFPSGQYNKTTLKLLSELGYTLSFTTNPGKVYLGDNQFKLNRVRIWNGMPFSDFIKQVS